MQQSLKTLVGTAVLALGGCAVESKLEGVQEQVEEISVPGPVCNQGQIWGNGQHSGIQCSGITGMRVAAKLLQDPSSQQIHDIRGFVNIHYGTPLTRGAWVFVPGKRGYTDDDNRGSATWSVTAHEWQGAKLVQRWSVDSAWKPFDAITTFGTTDGYEQVFQPAMTAAGIYMPESAGRLVRLDPTTGARLAVINPLAGTPFDGDPLALVNSSLTVAPDGSIVYTLAAWVSDGNPNIPPRGAWLVRVLADDSVTIAPWSKLAAASVGVPQERSLCHFQFGVAGTPAPLPWPPTLTELGPLFNCGAPRPPVNNAPAVSADGRYAFIASINNNAVFYSHVIKVDLSTMSPVWAASLRDNLFDGCGVNTPVNRPDNSVENWCRFGTTRGVDRTFNLPPAGRNTSLFATAPVVAPDGTIYISSYTSGYDANMGHLHRFSAAGQPLQTFIYGWEVTPAVIPEQGGGFSIATDFNENFATPYALRLSPELVVQTRTRIEDRGLQDTQAMNVQQAIDSEGNAYAVTMAGKLRKIDRAGRILETLLIGGSLELLNVSPAWGSDGEGRSVLYVPYAGRVLAVVGGNGTLANEEAEPLSDEAAEWALEGPTRVDDITDGADFPAEPAGECLRPPCPPPEMQLEQRCPCRICPCP